MLKGLLYHFTAYSHQKTINLIMIKEKMFIVPAEKEQSAVQQTKQSRRITVFYLLYLLLFRVQIKVEDTLFYKSQIVCTKTQKHMP